MRGQGQGDSVSSCAERVAQAAHILTDSGAPLTERLTDAALAIGILDPRDFPPDLRLSFARIHEAITAEGSFDDSVARMSGERRRGVSEDICGLAAEVARREAIENKD